jgi:dTDP-4-amino-4,6-dideoxygalactose transaminase
MRLTDVQGALGVVQMSRFEAIVARKHALAAEFDRRLQRIPWLRAPHLPAGYQHGYQAYCALFEPEAAERAVAARDQAAVDQLNCARNDVMRTLESKGVATRQGTHAVHIQQYYRETYGLKPMDYPSAYAADRLTMALPFYPRMSDADVDYLFEVLETVR